MCAQGSWSWSRSSAWVSELTSRPFKTPRPVRIHTVHVCVSYREGAVVTATAEVAGLLEARPQIEPPPESYDQVWTFIRTLSYYRTVWGN